MTLHVISLSQALSITHGSQYSAPNLEVAAYVAVKCLMLVKVDITYTSIICMNINSYIMYIYIEWMSINSIICVNCYRTTCP